MPTKKSVKPAAGLRLSREMEKSITELRKENERLNELIESLRAMAERQASFLSTESSLSQANADLRRALERKEGDLRAQEELLEAVRGELRLQQRQREALKQQVEEIRSQGDRFVDRYVALEKRAARVGNLLAVVSQLHAAHSEAEVYTAVEEILAAIVGTESFAVYELLPNEGALGPRFCVGMERQSLPPVRVGQGLIGKAAERMEAEIHPAERACEAPLEEKLSATVPLLLGPRVMGVLAIFELLPQKGALEDGDQDVLELLAGHVGLALDKARRLEQARKAG